MDPKDIPIIRSRRDGRLGAVAALLAVALTVSDAVAEGLECVVLPHSVLELSSGVSGRLSTVYVDRADRIEAGQIVAELESDVERANLALAEARASMLSEVRLREASYSFDQRQRERIDDLHERNAVSSQTMDEADRDARLGRWQVSLARERLELAALELERARAQLALRTVRAPFNGVVLERYKSEGEFVDEDAILQVARLDPLRVEVIAPLEMHEAFRAGMQASVFTETAPDTPRRANVIAVDPVADPASGTFRARLELPNPDHALLAGVKCTAELVTAVAQTAPAVAERSNPPTPPSTPVSDAPSSMRNVDASARAQPDVNAVASISDESSATVESLDNENAPPLEQAVTPVDQTSPETPSAAATPPATQTNTAARAPTAPEGCQTLGPIDTRQVANGVARQLRNAAFEVHPREGLQRVRNGFIVLANVARPGESAREVSKRLRARGVDDLAPLGKGPFAGRVSLGVYDDAGSASRRVNALAQLDVDAEVRARHRSRPSWWLDVTVDAGAEQARLRATVIQHLPALRIQPAPCAPIQTARN